MASLQQSSLIFFLVTITLFFFFASPVLCKPGNETRQLIDRICHDKQVDDYEFCQKTFHNHLECPTADIRGLAKLTIRRTYNIAVYVFTNILHLLEHKADPSTKKELQQCRDAYDVVILQFELVELLVKKHEYKDAYDATRETVLALEECKADIEIPRHPKSPVIEANKHTRTLIAMSLASLKLLLRSN